MAYIGTQPLAGQYRKLDDISSGFNGATTSFTTSVGGTNVTAGSPQQLLVSLGGVIQQPTTDYTVNTSTIIFTTAPASGLSFFAILMGDALNTSVPADGSITSAKLAGSLSVGLAAGSASTPSLFFTGDTNTGIYSPGADQVAISTNGTGRLTVDSGGRVLVGTSSSDSSLQSSLQVVGANFAATQLIYRYGSTANGPTLYLGKSRSATIGTKTVVQNGDILGTFNFYGADGSSDVLAAQIEAYVDGTPGANDMPGRIVLSTTADGASSPTERMRITSAGLVGIGTASPGAIFQTRVAADKNIAFNLDSNSEARISCFNDAISASAPLGFNGTDLRFQTGNTERGRFDSSGRLLVGTTTATANGGVLQVSNGITFPATQSACSDVNTLDDYEEGTWTPGLSYETPGTLSVTYSNRSGAYTKIGKVVYFSCDLRLSSFSKGTASGAPQVTGLPFTSQNFFGYENPRVVITLNDWTFTTTPTAAVISASTGVSLGRLVSNSSGANLDDPRAGSIVWLTGFYFV